MIVIQYKDLDNFLRSASTKGVGHIYIGSRVVMWTGGESASSTSHLSFTYNGEVHAFSKIEETYPRPQFIADPDVERQKNADRLKDTAIMLRSKGYECFYALSSMDNDEIMYG